jgi:asparagine synthase (glutamine-hydrolysing)
VFLCLLSLDGSAVSDVERMRYAERIRSLAKASAVESERVEMVDDSAFVAFVAPALVPLRSLRGRAGGLVGIGNMRLDHRDEVRRWGHVAQADASDLDLVLSAVEARGAHCLRAVLGDFAVVVWDPRTRILTAARDALGVRTLFVGERGRLLVLSSHLELVRQSDALDEEYVADFLVAGDPGPERTIWADSRAVPQGSISSWREGRLTRERFWDPFDFEPAADCDPHERVEQFRVLFRDAVRARVEPNGKTWAELSGGLDSSSIVSMTQMMVEEGVVPGGIAGTITIVDELGLGDERRYSDLVLQRFRLPTATVANPWPWQDDGRTPPRTDEPRTHYPFFARDRLICDTVRNAGAQVLLSGFGSDHYLYGNRMFIADLAGRGHMLRACREVARWAVQERRSFWTDVRHDVIAPFFPAMTPKKIDAIHTVPGWIDPAFAKRRAISSRLPAFRGPRAPRGHKFAHCVAAGMQEVVRWLPRGSFEDGLELRYPFFYRPLVELGLRLPPSMRAQPLVPKWVLREAMKGVLPEPIRVRTGKGAIDARLTWGFSQERRRLSAVLADSTLASLGILRRDRLDAAVDRAARGEAQSITTLLAALSLETWLFVRSDRWNVGKEVEMVGSRIPHPRKIQSA